MVSRTPNKQTQNELIKTNISMNLNAAEEMIEKFKQEFSKDCKDFLIACNQNQADDKKLTNAQKNIIDKSKKFTVQLCGKVFPNMLMTFDASVQDPKDENFKFKMRKILESFLSQCEQMEGLIDEELLKVQTKGIQISFELNSQKSKKQLNPLERSKLNDLQSKSDRTKIKFDELKQFMSQVHQFQEDQIKKLEKHLTEAHKNHPFIQIQNQGGVDNNLVIGGDKTESELQLYIQVQDLIIKNKNLQADLQMKDVIQSQLNLLKESHQKLQVSFQQLQAENDQLKRIEKSKEVLLQQQKAENEQLKRRQSNVGVAQSNNLQDAQIFSFNQQKPFEAIQRTILEQQQKIQESQNVKKVNMPQQVIRSVSPKPPLIPKEPEETLSVWKCPQCKIMMELTDGSCRQCQQQIQYFENVQSFKLEEMIVEVKKTEFLKELKSNLIPQPVEEVKLIDEPKGIKRIAYKPPLKEPAAQIFNPSQSQIIFSKSSAQQRPFFDAKEIKEFKMPQTPRQIKVPQKYGDSFLDDFIDEKHHASYSSLPQVDKQVDWKCGYCKFINVIKPTFNKDPLCVQCKKMTFEQSKNRPETPKQQEIASLLKMNTKWTCSSCFVANNHSNQSCLLCGKQKIDQKAKLGKIVGNPSKSSVIDPQDQRCSICTKITTIVTDQTYCQDCEMELWLKQQKKRAGTSMYKMCEKCNIEPLKQSSQSVCETCEKKQLKTCPQCFKKKCKDGQSKCDDCKKVVLRKSSVKKK